MCCKDEMLHDHRDDERVAALAAAVSGADDVRRLPPPGARPQCLICGREGEFGTVVLHRTSSLGSTEAANTSVVGVCKRCRGAADESRAAAVQDLVNAAERGDALLVLIRRRASGALAGWWGGVGACTADDVDQASIAVRRAIERVGAKP